MNKEELMNKLLKHEKFLNEIINNGLIASENNYYKGELSVVQEVIQSLEQLEEPEVLSREWIDEHKKSYTMEDSVEISDLQNLLVLEEPETDDSQVVVEKPVIPQFVADWIEEQKHELNDMDDNIIDDSIIYNAISETDTDMTYANILPENLNRYIKKRNNGASNFAKAVIAGYEVEEEKEQKYYVLIVNGSVILRRNTDKEYDSAIAYVEGGRSIKHIVAHEEESLYQLTEQEIKDYDERFWPFAVRVEEVEE